MTKKTKANITEKMKSREKKRLIVLAVVAVTIYFVIFM